MSSPDLTPGPDAERVLRDGLTGLATAASVDDARAISTLALVLADPEIGRHPSSRAGASLALFRETVLGEPRTSSLRAIRSLASAMLSEFRGDGSGRSGAQHPGVE